MTAAETRHRILRAVLRVIGAEGVAGVTNRRVAREAGVSLGSITYHFTTQQELQREALLLFVREETARLTAIADRQATHTSVAEAASLVEQIAEDITFGDEELAPLELYIQAGRDPQLRTAAAECFAAYEQLAATVLATLAVPDPDRLAGPVVALVAGLQLRRMATGTTGRTGLGDALTMMVRGTSR